LLGQRTLSCSSIAPRNAKAVNKCPLHSTSLLWPLALPYSAGCKLKAEIFEARVMHILNFHAAAPLQACTGASSATDGGGNYFNLSQVTLIVQIHGQRRSLAGSLLFLAKGDQQLTHSLRKPERVFLSRWILIAAIGVGFYYHPYFSSRTCWGNLSWTSDAEFMTALFRIEFPEVTSIVIVSHEDSGLLRAAGGGVWIRASPPKLNYPRFHLRGDSYSGLISMEVISPTGIRVTFFDNCGRFAGLIQ
jgi:hypothetical protein